MRSHFSLSDSNERRGAFAAFAAFAAFPAAYAQARRFVLASLSVATYELFIARTRAQRALSAGYLHAPTAKLGVSSAADCERARLLRGVIGR